MANIIKNKENIIKALEQSLGIVTSACKKVGISRGQYYVYLREDELFRQRVQEIQELALDFTETQLFKLIKEGSERSILFYLKYKGKNRGYTNHLEINASMKVLEVKDIRDLIDFKETEIIDIEVIDED